MRAAVARRDDGQQPGEGAVLAGLQHRQHRNDAGEDAGEQDRHFADRLPGEVVGLAVLVRREHERQDRDQEQRGVAHQVLQLEPGAVDVEADARLPCRRGEDGADDGGDQQEIDAAAARASLVGGFVSPTVVTSRSLR